MASNLRVTAGRVLSKNEIKNIRKLHLKKGREKSGEFIIEGEKLVREAIDSNYEIVALYTSNEALLKSLPNSCSIIGAKEMKSISQLVNPSDILATVKSKNPNIGLPELSKTKSIVLDSIRDPGNLGTIIRTADWFGIHSIILIGDCVETYNPKVVHASMGSFFRSSILRMTLDELSSLKDLNPSYRFVGAQLIGESPAVLPSIENGCIVIGNEARGLSDKVLNMIDTSVSIKKIGGAESLNAAMAAGILMHSWTNLQN